MGLLPDIYNCGLRMRRNAGNVFPATDFKGNRYVTHVPWCMSGSLTQSGGENVPGIPGAYKTHKSAYLARNHPQTNYECGVITQIYSSNQTEITCVINQFAACRNRELVSLNANSSFRFVLSGSCIPGSNNGLYLWRYGYWIRQKAPYITTPRNLKLMVYTFEYV